MLQTVSKWFESNWEQLLWLCAIIFTQGCQVNMPCWLYKIPNTHRYKSFWRKSDFTVLCDDLSMCVRIADKCLNTVWTDWHFWCEMIFLIYLGLRLLEPENLFFLGILFIHCTVYDYSAACSIGPLYTDLKCIGRAVYIIHCIVHCIKRIPMKNKFWGSRSLRQR